MKNHTRNAAAVLLIAICSSLAAQDAPRPAGPRTLVGVVRDTAGFAVDSADVSILSIRRRTTSAGDGSFRFSDIGEGSYDVTVRKLGYVAEVKSVRVGGDGGVVVFQLIPLPRRLPTVVSSVSRGGLSGMIGDTSLKPLRNVEIRIYGASKSIYTDSAGFFFADVRPGPYMLRLSRRGYASQVLSVRVPQDSGRRITAWLAPATGGQNNREVQMLIDMQHRISGRNVVWSSIKTREDILKMNIPDVTMIVSAAAGRRVEPDCPVRVNGDSLQRVSLWELTPSDIEFMETYTPRPPRMNINSIMGGGNVRRPAEPRCVPIYVWLHK